MLFLSFSPHKSNSLPTSLSLDHYPLKQHQIKQLDPLFFQGRKKIQNKSLSSLKSFSSFSWRDFPLNSLTWFTGQHILWLFNYPSRTLLTCSSWLCPLNTLWPPWTHSTSLTLVPHLSVPYIGSLTWNKFFLSTCSYSSLSSTSISSIDKIHLLTYFLTGAVPTEKQTINVFC